MRQQMKTFFLRSENFFYLGKCEVENFYFRKWKLCYLPKNAKWKLFYFGKCITGNWLSIWKVKFSFFFTFHLPKELRGTHIDQFFKFESEKFSALNQSSKMLRK